jgi:citrate lyase subunit beta/citryl-CoA lyase
MWGVSLGEADLRAQVRTSGPEVISHIRSRLVIASAAAGKRAPMGSAFLNIHDHEALVADTRLLAGQGFLGRTAVHPSQLPHIREAFKPTAEEYEAARRVFDSANREVGGPASGASALADGTFIDQPVIVRAQQTIELWEIAESRND